MAERNPEGTSNLKRKEREKPSVPNNGRRNKCASSSHPPPPVPRADRSKTSKPVKENKQGIIKVDIPQLSDELSKLLVWNTRNVMVKKPVESTKKLGLCETDAVKEKKCPTNLNDSQTAEIKNALADCLHNLNLTKQRQGVRRDTVSYPAKIQQPTTTVKSFSGNRIPPSGTCESSTKASLLRSYLTGANPAREEYVSKRSNVSNSLISSDSIHHSIFLESNRERRQCLLQYLSTIVSEGQVIIYASTIPGVESLKEFLATHGFQSKMVHPEMLLAESNWILSEFSLKKFSILLCAEDHYHSCPAHFRWVKTIINYELPITKHLENWTNRNGIVEFSDNLPVHIYTFLKKACSSENELVKLLQLDSEDQDELLPELNEQAYSIDKIQK